MFKKETDTGKWWRSDEEQKKYEAEKIEKNNFGGYHDPSDANRIEWKIEDPKEPAKAETNLNICHTTSYGQCPCRVRKNCKLLKQKQLLESQHLLYSYLPPVVLFIYTCKGT